jgi:hypothetical protein
MKTAYSRHLSIIIAALLFSQVFLPFFDAGKLQEGRVSAVEDEFLEYAEVAWRYFQAGVGVDEDTGLHYGSFVPPNGGWKCLTDWDLGCYIMAILDAEKIEIITSSGPWGADQRIEKILTFMEDRQLHADGVPFLNYDSTTGLKSNNNPTNVYDTGRLLVALHNLKLSRPGLEDRINNIIHDKCDYTSMASSLSSSPNPEHYLLAKGFSYFGFDGTNIQDGMDIPEDMMTGTMIDIYGVQIPRVKLISEQVLHVMFEVEIDENFAELAHRTYLIQERRWLDTGEYTAFTEGNIENDPYYIYEYLVSPPNTWYIMALATGELVITPIAYIKAAIGYHALYDTGYTKDMVDYLTSRLETDYGYKDGVDEDGNRVDVLSDKTNSMIISAARYALDHPFNLEEFPHPFIDPVDSSPDVTLITGASDPRGPVYASHTIDVAAGQYLAYALGRRSTVGSIETCLDWEATTFNATHVSDVWRSGNIATYGAPWVNLVSNFFHKSLVTASGESVLRSYMGEDTEGQYIYSKPSGVKYRMVNDYGQGYPVTDYAMIVLYEDTTNERWVLIVAGLSGYATREATRWLATFPTMEENHIILQMNDYEGNGDIDEISKIEPTTTGATSTGDLVGYSGGEVRSDGTGSYTLSDFPEPFINVVDGITESMLTPGACDPRGPCSSAHTIDVAAGQKLAFTMGQKSPSGGLEVFMDWETTSFNSSHVTDVWRAGNIITFGSPSVNTVSNYYHNQTEGGVPVLPVYMDRDGAGAQGQFIYSSSSTNEYRMTNDYGQGYPVTDYAMVTLHYDEGDDRYVLIVAGLSGYATREAAGWLSSLPDMDGAAVILELNDAEGDGQIESITVKETVY